MNAISMQIEERAAKIKAIQKGHNTITYKNEISGRCSKTILSAKSGYDNQKAQKKELGRQNETQPDTRYCITDTTNNKNSELGRLSKKNNMDDMETCKMALHSILKLNGTDINAILINLKLRSIKNRIWHNYSTNSLKV